MLDLTEYPIIAAVRTGEELLAALSSPCGVIFWLAPNVNTMEEYLAKVKKAQPEKKVFVHIDMAEGIGKDGAGVEYLGKIGVDGIISTRSNLIRYAKDAGLATVQRFFIVDSHSVEIAFDTVRTSKPDMIEIMPGVLPRQIEAFSDGIGIPLIAGGLIETKNDVIAALSAGASAISTSRRELWLA